MPDSPIEVEFKFPVTDFDAVRDGLDALGAQSRGRIRQSDCYFNDPLRNYARLDIALRLRADGERHWVTYKGPRLDDRAKIRHEVEIPLGGAEIADQWQVLLQGLGLETAGHVHKERETFHLTWEGAEVEVSLDAVRSLGFFVELERVVEAPEQVAGAKAQLADLAETLGLSGPIQDSYLDLLRQQPEDGQGA